MRIATERTTMVVVLAAVVGMVLGAALLLCLLLGALLLATDSRQTPADARQTPPVVPYNPPAFRPLPTVDYQATQAAKRVNDRINDGLRDVCEASGGRWQESFGGESGYCVGGGRR